MPRPEASEVRALRHIRSYAHGGEEPRDGTLLPQWTPLQISDYPVMLGESSETPIDAIGVSLRTNCLLIG